MGHFLKQILGMIWVFAESLETSSLKKKLAKQIKINEEIEEYKKLLEADIEHLRSELNTSFSDRDSSEQQLRSELASCKRDRDTHLENNRALLEKQERLELDIAKQKAELAVNSKQLELMASLVELHRKEVSASIAHLADSYANNQRPRRDSE